MDYQIEGLKNWLALNNIKHKYIEERVFKCANKTYVLLLHKQQNKILNQNMTLLLSEEDLSLLERYLIDRFVILFGDKFYYIDDTDLFEKSVFDEVGDIVGTDLYIQNMHPLLYIGESTVEQKLPHLGIHGGYDICNGSRSYADWCTKAKWIGITTLGICEENTLAGTLLFQAACQSAKINSIIGETIVIQYDSSTQYHLKLYCRDIEGWRNLCRINAKINISILKSIQLKDLLDLSQGLICVLTPTIPLDKIITEVKLIFKEIYYQLDFVEWDNAVKEEDWLVNNIQLYLEHYSNSIKPLSLYDSYYLEQGDNEIQKVLWRIGKKDNFKYRSRDRYFKTFDEYSKQAFNLFDIENSDKACSILIQAADNLKMFEEILFRIPVGEKHLPEYELTQDQLTQFQTSDNLFWYLINKGLQEKVIDKGLDVDVYLERIQQEVEVIELGHVKDYFLIVWDILNFCKQNEIIYGVGRGSAAGCLVSYLLGIVQIDPIHYDLLFERFLNKGRVGKSLPDIDNDIQGSRREEVKRYVEERYGEDYVAGIGTYGTFKMRAALKDLIREIGGDSKEANYISAILEEEDKFIDLFTKALDPTVNPRLYHFVKKHSYQINHIPQLFKQPKTQSIHAAGVIIVPKGNGPIYRQLPVKKMNDIVITEWEGAQIEEAGFLKVDILGIKQLDKFDEIIRLIKENRGETIVLNDIPLDTDGVYRFFQKGFNEDVFQFGGGGLKGYCKVLRPDNIEDLIATVALYRPGPIEINAHEKYAKIKNGELEPQYYFGLEQITKATYSQIVYQEQIMRIVQELGGFSLVEADDIRKAMGKKLLDVMVKYKQLFVDGAVAKGCPQDEANRLWTDMEGFAGYAFNRSHAACYGITGYYSQWLKYSYPLEFWLTSLKYSKDDQVQSRIAEIKHIAEGISIKGPDVIHSQRHYHGDVKTNTIYWSLNSIKHVGEVALKEIERLRSESSFFDLEDFVKAVQLDREKRRLALQPGERINSPINRRVICNLIIAGAFDIIEKVKRPYQRGDVLSKYFEILHPELRKDQMRFQPKLWQDRMGIYYDFLEYNQDYKWILEQRKLCGFGSIDYIPLLKDLPYKNRGLFKENGEILSTGEEGTKAIVAGVVESIAIRQSKNGNFAQVLVHDGFAELYLTVWADTFQSKEAEITASKGKLIFMDGEIKYDAYKKQKTIHSKSYTKLEILN